jgi:hypothetical protein
LSVYAVQLNGRNGHAMGWIVTHVLLSDDWIVKHTELPIAVRPSEGSEGLHLREECTLNCISGSSRSDFFGDRLKFKYVD